MNMDSHKFTVASKVTLYDKNMNVVEQQNSPTPLYVPDDYIELLVKEANGVIVQKEKVPFRSFTRQWMIAVDSFMGTYNNGNGLSYYAMTSSTGTTTINDTRSWPRSNPGSTDPTYGISVGTGSAAANYHNIKLGGLINHGSGVGQLFYNAQTYDSLVYSGSITKASIRRTFTNQNAASIVVKETGFFTYNYPLVTSQCMCRDLLQYDGSSINVTVAQNQVLEVVYNFYTDANNGFLSTFLNWFLYATQASTVIPVVCLDGSTRTYSAPSISSIAGIYLYFNYGPGTSSFGICIGNGGSVPISSSNYKLGNQILHGTASNQINYGTTTYSPFTASIVSQSMTTIASRRFQNLSGITQTVNEIGIISLGTWGVTNGQTQLVRKVIDPVYLANGETLDVTFLFIVSASVV